MELEKLESSYKEALKVEKAQAQEKLGTGGSWEGAWERRRVPAMGRGWHSPVSKISFLKLRGMRVTKDDTGSGGAGGGELCPCFSLKICFNP